MKEKPQRPDETGLGYAEGMVKYDGVLKNGEKVPLEGPFKLYLQLKYGWWNIFFVYWPGMEW